MQILNNISQKVSEMKDKVKNESWNSIKDAYVSVMPVKTESEFIKKGTLTVDEFVEAGDQLVKACPAWQWKSASDKKYESNLFDECKQYLQTRVQSSKRVKDIMTDNQKEEQTIDDWVINDIKPKQMTSEQIDLQQCINEDGDSDRYVVVQQDDFIEQKHRLYTISITYDLFYRSPKMFLTAVDYENRPLTQTEIYEDIMTDYAHKTVTFENMPFTNNHQACIHNCKHPQALKTLIDMMISNGVDVKSYQALFIFLKFMSSIIPTIEYDFSMDVFLA